MARTNLALRYAMPGRKRVARSKAGYKIVATEKIDEVALRIYTPEGHLLTRIKLTYHEWEKLQS